MRRLPSISTLVGFDVAVVADLPRQDRKSIRRLSSCMLLPCLLVAASAGLGAWQLEGSAAAAIVLGLAAGLGILNLLRVVIAGGGAAAHAGETQVRAWAPKLTPLLLLGALAACFAQPVYIELRAASLDPQIDAHRDALLTRHRLSVERLRSATAGESVAAPGPVTVAASNALASNYEPATNDGFERQVMGCQFVTKRLALAWASPETPTAFTALYCLLALIPILLTHSTHLRPLRAYELARWRQTRACVHADERQTQNAVHEQLALWPLLPKAVTALPLAARPPAGLRGRPHHGRTPK